MITDGLHEGEGLVKAAFVEVVKEDAADAAGFVAVWQVEVFVADVFEFWIQLVAKGGAGVACGLVPVDGVFAVAVVGREVEATAEPPDWLAVGRFCIKEAHIHMRGGHMWVEWVAHKRDAHRAKGGAGELWARGRGGGRQAGALHVGKINAGFFEDLAAFEHAGTSATAFGAVPVVFAKGAAAVLLFEGVADAVLQVE